MFADRELAQRIWELRRGVMRPFAEAARDRLGYENTWMESGSVFAVYAGPESPITQAYGFGHSGEVTASDLQPIEAFYRGRTPVWEMVLTPFCHPSAHNVVIEAGGRVQQFENVYYRPVEPMEVRLPTGGKLVEVSAETLDLWKGTVLRGFMGDATGRIADELGILMAHTPGVRRYLVLVDGEPAGGCSSQVVGNTVFLGGMATLPNYRGRGLQAALIAHRINQAAGQADMAVVETMPGTTSMRNAERAGFRAAFTVTSYTVPG